LIETQLQEEDNDEGKVDEVAEDQWNNDEESKEIEGQLNIENVEEDVQIP